MPIFPKKYAVNKVQSDNKYILKNTTGFWEGKKNLVEWGRHSSTLAPESSGKKYYSTLFPSPPSLKSNSWHLEAIWSRSMGLTPVVICLTALGDGQGRCACVCVCVCMCVQELVGWGLSEEEPGDGNSMEEYKPCLTLTGNLESRSSFYLSGQI